MNHIHTCPSLVLKLFTLGLTLCGKAVPYVEYALIDEEFPDPDIDLTSGLELFESVSAAVMTFSIQLEKFVTINFTSSSHILNASMRSSVTVSLHFLKCYQTNMGPTPLILAFLHMARIPVLRIIRSIL